MATRSRRIEIRVTESDWELQEAVARSRGETLSEFVRRAAHTEAERAMNESSRLVVDDEKARRFLDALEGPTRASETGLRRLIEKPSVLASE